MTVAQATCDVLFLDELDEWDALNDGPTVKVLQ